jgi:hypothetical protein
VRLPLRLELTQFRGHIKLCVQGVLTFPRKPDSSKLAGATLENLRKFGSRGYLYTLGDSKTNQDGKVNPNDDKPIAGIAAAALDAWL